MSVSEVVFQKAEKIEHPSFKGKCLSLSVKKDIFHNTALYCCLTWFLYCLWNIMKIGIMPVRSVNVLYLKENAFPGDKVTARFFFPLCIRNLTIHFNYLNQTPNSSPCRQRCYINVKQELMKVTNPDHIHPLPPQPRNNTVLFGWFGTCQS